jgi:hypothetical protein
VATQEVDKTPTTTVEAWVPPMEVFKKLAAFLATQEAGKTPWMVLDNGPPPTGVGKKLVAPPITLWDPGGAAIFD